MNFKCEPLIWQTWSDKWGSWDNWFHATGQGQLPEASSRETQPPDFDADQEVITQLERSHTKRLEPLSYIL
jgi:hypothetical protein